MKFAPEVDIPDLSGKVIFVTGGNIGLGRETIFQLAKHNPLRIFLAARNKSKAEAAIEQLKEDLPQDTTPIEFIELDLTSFDSIKRAASDFQSRSDRLDILINNAGILGSPPGTTKEGYEIHFGTNVIGHALLTGLLLPELEATALKHQATDVRIVNVASDAYKTAPKAVYPLAKLKGEFLEVSWWTRYALSKLANIHFTQELARRHPDITCVALHPGSVNTNIAASFFERHPWLAWPLQVLISTFTVSVREGALNQLWAATAKDVKSGAYYASIGKESNDKKVNNPAAAEELWNWTEEQIRAAIENRHVSS